MASNRARDRERDERRDEQRAEHVFEWNGAAGVRELRPAPRDDAFPDLRRPDECVGEICEPMS